MNINKLAYLFLTSILFFSCDQSGLIPTDEDIPVIEAYLFANSEIDDIRVTKMIPFGSSFDEVTPVNDLAIYLNKENESYLLVPSEGDSGYYHYPNNDLVIEEGDHYEISFEYNGNSISAETKIPSPPDTITSSVNELLIEPIDDFTDLRNRNFPEPVEVYWDNPDSSWFYVLVENAESNPSSINTIDGFDGRRFRLITEPTQGNFYVLPPPTLTQYGTHRIVLFKVNQEYADLYENGEQDSRNLNEPLTNISNGLGIFTAFNSDTSFLEVKRP